MAERSARLRTRILSISDEIELHRLLRATLEPERFEIMARTWAAAELASERPPEIVIADLPQFEPQIVQSLRRRSPAAELIVLCQADREGDCVRAIEMGVEFLARPFRKTDLKARVRSAELRRYDALGIGRKFRIGDAEFDPLDHLLKRDGAAFPLNFSEQTLLALLIRSAGRLVKFPELLTALGRANDVSGRQFVRALVCSLRKKIDGDRAQTQIENEPRVGYRLLMEIARGARR